MRKSLVLVAVILALVPPPGARADSAADFGRAQTNKNSYEARQEWRQRNVKPIQFGTAAPAPVPDNAPRSSDEINAETAERMAAMQRRWATKPLTADEEAARKTKWRIKQEKEMYDRWNKTYPRLLKNARKAVVGSDEKWAKFKKNTTREEDSLLVGGNEHTEHSPLADIGREILVGDKKNPGDAALARLVWTRGRELGDYWCRYELGLLEASSGTPAGLKQAFDWFYACKPFPDHIRVDFRAGLPLCAVEVARARAFGLGVEVDYPKADEAFRHAAQIGNYATLSPAKPDEGWVQFQMLNAAFYRQGVVRSKNPVEADRILTAVAQSKAPQPWRAYVALLQAGSDLDDKRLAWRLLNDASAAGWPEAGGHLVVKLLKGEGVEASVDEAYALAMGLPGMRPEATAQAAKLLMPIAPNKAADILERHALKEDVELQALLAQAKDPNWAPPATPAPALMPSAAAGSAAVQWVSIPGGNGLKPFELAKTEVTNKQYRACVEAGVCSASGAYVGGDDHPVVNVDWEQAKRFSAWAGGRLPSEAEWAHAARSGGKQIDYPWGNDDATCATAIIRDCGTGAAPVCSKPAGNTAQGLCDMAGNAWEWTRDWFNGAPADSAASPGAARVFRGGSWKDGAVKAGFRDGNIPGARAVNVGLRPAR